ncbi:hypothetical protein BCR42DRAFT_426310, partial [Absidia repens]
SYLSLCHHPHMSDTRLPIASQQLYLVTLQHNLTLAMFHLVYNQDQIKTHCHSMY